MERFCNKCGSLVSGDGVFCPNCGEKLDSAVDLGKPSSQVQDLMPTGASGATAGTSAGTSGASATGATGASGASGFSTPASSSVYGSTNTTGTYGTTNTANTSGYQGQMPSYSQPVQPINTQPEMTTGQWVLTIFLSGLGIIGIILLFVWAFGNDTPTSKRNYSRAMLIWYAISVGLVVILYIGLFACAGAMAGGLEGIFDAMDDMGYYAAINNLFIR